MPNWITGLGLAALVSYQMFNALAMRQATRTQTSPLGQLLCTSLDQLALLSQMVSLCALLKVNDDVWRVVSLVPAIMSPHFCIEYRAHFTGFRETQVGMVGTTSWLILVQLLHLIVWLMPESNDCLEVVLHLADDNF